MQAMKVCAQFTTLLSSVVASAWAGIVSVDVAEWARTGTGVTPSGWVVVGIDTYMDGSVKVKEEADSVLSPFYSFSVTQLVMTVKASSEATSRFLTVVPEAANAGARDFTALAIDSYVDQTFVWDPKERVCQFRIKNIGKGISGWGIRSLTVYLDRIEPPRDLREDGSYSDALSVRWTSDSCAVFSEFELDRVLTVPPSYVELKAWDFASLTNTSGNSKSFRDLDPPEGLKDVGGRALNLQGKAGGHLQVGKRDEAGVMTVPLPEAKARTALMTLFKHSSDVDSEVEVCSVSDGGVTNGSFRPFLTECPTSYAFPLSDDAELLMISSRPKHRVRVKDVQAVTDYIPGCLTTNQVVRSVRGRNARTVLNLSPGDFIWRVQSFDRQGVASGWSPYKAVTLLAGDARYPVPGFRIFIK